MQSGFSNTNTVPLWDFSHPQSFSQLPDDDFLALLQKQFPTTATGGYDDSAVSLGGSAGNPFGAVSGVNPFQSDAVPNGGLGAYAGIDPQSISTTHFPMADFADPPSEDSSPSPPGTSVQESSAPRSRRDSTIEIDNGSVGDESMSLFSNKRKVDDDDDDFDEGPSTKHAASSSANNKKISSSSSARRKSTGHKDEGRLLKRKEQNRAAQRAFRERKEKHVRDLEEKVAQLEAKNETTQAENENLRDLLNRLRQENMELKRNQNTPTSQHPHTKFEFRMPRTSSSPMASSSSSGSASGSSSGSSPSATSATDSPDTASASKPDWSGLQTFDPNGLNLLDETPQTTATDLQLDFPFGDGGFDGSPSGSSSMDTSGGNNHGMPALGKTPFTTIASNPNFTSFADFDSTSFGNMGGDISLGTEFGGAFEWPPAPPMQDGGMGSSPYDDPFGQDFFGSAMNSGPMDFAALMKSTPSAIGSTHGGGNSNTSSPVSHRQNSSDNNNGSSTVTGLGSCPTSTGECPTTKAELKKCIEAEGQSPFAPTSPPAVDSNSGSSGSTAASSASSPSMESIAATPLSCTMLPMPMVSPAEGGAQSLLKKGAAGILCHGSSIPKTEKSEKNVEVLSAWRTITNDPGFKDADINELCVEFSQKARCDGEKVVLEPSGVQHILQTLNSHKQRRALGLTNSSSFK